MRRSVAGVAGWMLLAVSISGQAAPPAEAAPSAAKSTREKADQAELLSLAKAMAPREAMIAKEMATFTSQFPAELRKQEGFANLEAAYPSLVPELERRMRDPFTRYMDRMLEKYFREVATLLGEELDAEGVATLSRFYTSPAGPRIVLAMIDNFDGSELVDTYSKGEEPDAAMMQRGLKGAASKATRNLSAEDQTSLILLMKEPSFWALSKINPRIQEIKLQVMNADDPEFNKDIETVFEEVMTSLDGGAGSEEQ